MISLIKLGDRTFLKIKTDVIPVDKIVLVDLNSDGGHRRASIFLSDKKIFHVHNGDVPLLTEFLEKQAI